MAPSFQGLRHTCLIPRGQPPGASFSWGEPDSHPLPPQGPRPPGLCSFLTLGARAGVLSPPPSGPECINSPNTVRPVVPIRGSVVVMHCPGRSHWVEGSPLCPPQRTSHLHPLSVLRFLSAGGKGVSTILSCPSEGSEQGSSTHGVFSHSGLGPSCYWALGAMGETFGFPRSSSKAKVLSSPGPR